MVAGPEHAKKPAGKSPPPDSDPFGDTEFGENLTCSLSNRRERELLIRVPETPSTFHQLTQRTAFRHRDVRQQSRSFARWNRRPKRSPNVGKLYSHSDAAVIRVYDESGNVIETHEHTGDFKEW